MAIITFIELSSPEYMIYYLSAQVKWIEEWGQKQWKQSAATNVWYCKVSDKLAVHFIGTRISTRSTISRKSVM